jgi:Uma2 family endonuclease
MGAVFPVFTTSQSILGAEHRKRWTRAELAQLESLDVFEAGRYELLEGELLDTMGKLPPHTYALLSILKFLRAAFGDDFLSHESVIDLDPEDNPTNAPEPDAIVLWRPFREFFQRHPGPQDIRLLVEVADSSLSIDTRVKRDLYARAAIAEYWVVDLNGRRLIVFRAPQQGTYTEQFVVSEAESISPLAAPANAMPLTEILPPL